MGGFATPRRRLVQSQHGVPFVVRGARTEMAPTASSELSERGTRLPVLLLLLLLLLLLISPLRWRGC